MSRIKEVAEALKRENNGITQKDMLFYLIKRVDDQGERLTEIKSKMGTFVTREEFNKKENSKLTHLLSIFSLIVSFIACAAVVYATFIH